jgi:hypothetical protein
MLRFGLIALLALDVIAVTCGPDDQCRDEDICTPDEPGPTPADRPRVGDLPQCVDGFEIDELDPVASIDIDGEWQVVYGDEVGAYVCVSAER